MTRFVTVEDVLVLAEAALRGPPGVRDLGLVDSAVARPQACFDGVEAYPSVHLKAAALLQSLVGNHAFVDGNKRAAFVSLLFFYDLNGLRLTLSHEQAFDLVIGVVVARDRRGGGRCSLAAGTAPRERA